MLRGVVTSVTFLGVHYEIIVDIGGFKWMIQTTDFVDVDEHIGLYIEPDAIHIMHKSGVLRYVRRLLVLLQQSLTS